MPKKYIFLIQTAITKLVPKPNQTIIKAFLRDEIKNLTWRNISCQHACKILMRNSEKEKSLPESLPKSKMGALTNTSKFCNDLASDAATDGLTTEESDRVNETVDPGGGGIIPLKVQLELNKEHGDTSEGTDRGRLDLVLFL